VSQKAPLEDRFSERVSLGRTGVEFGNRRLVLHSTGKDGERKVILLNRDGDIVAENVLGYRRRRSGERFAAAQIHTIAILFVLHWRLLSMAGDMFCRGLRVRQHFPDRTMIRRVKPCRHRNERDGRAENAGSQRLLHR